MSRRQRTVWFHCFNGIAGDMALGALLDAGAPIEQVRAELDSLPIDGWSLQMQRTQRGGIGATQAVIETADTAGHRHFAEIAAMLGGSPAQRLALAVFEELAEVEGAIHGVAASEVEFHEVGSLDAIVDVVGVCAALVALEVGEVHCSPIALGGGTVRAAHGTLPVPAPAVVSLLARRRAPATGGPLAVELATPTGVALMTVLAEEFGEMPPLTVERVGYGAGTKDFPEHPNLVQVVVGSSSAVDTGDGQPVQLLETNLDDVTGEVLARCVEALLAAGAHDAWVTPIVMKKGRPAHTLHALCDPAISADVRAVLVRESGTLGVRGAVLDRWPQRRRQSTVEIDGLPLAVKLGEHRRKVEHDQARQLADTLDLPLRTVLGRAEHGDDHH